MYFDISSLLYSPGSDKEDNAIGRGRREGGGGRARAHLQVARAVRREAAQERQRRHREKGSQDAHPQSSVSRNYFWLIHYYESVIAK